MAYNSLDKNGSNLNEKTMGGTWQDWILIILGNLRKYVFRIIKYYCNSWKLNKISAIQKPAETL